MTNRRILLIDIGNTNVKLGFADRSGLIADYSLPTALDGTVDSWGFALSTACGREAGAAGELGLEAAVISSVVPPVNPVLTGALRKYLDLDPKFVPGDIPLDLVNRYERPAEVGADRLATAYAARELFDTHNIISVDFGTATTFDVVSGRAYMGGLICPGVRSSAEALTSRAAKLPRIDLRLESSDIHVGKNTAQSLNQGFVFGFASMAEGLLYRLRDTLDGPTTCVATGGFAHYVAEACRCFDEVRTDLLLEGLRLAYYTSSQ